MNNPFRAKVISLMAIGAFMTGITGCGSKTPPPEAQFKVAEESIARAKANPIVVQYASDYLKKADSAFQEAKDLVAAKDEGKYEMAQVSLAKAQIYPELAEKIAEMREMQSRVEGSAAEAKAAEARAKAEVQTVVALLKRTKSLIPHLRNEMEKLINELDAIMKEFDDIEKRYPASSKSSSDEKS